MSNPSLPLLIEPDQLEPLLGDPALLIIDLCNTDSYRERHIPGAIHLPPGLMQGGIKPAVGRLPDEARLQQLFSAIGLTPDRHVIAYDDEGGGWAGRLIWTLDVLGHNRYSYLNGGIHAWANEEHPLENGVNQAQPSTYNVTIHREPIAEAEDIMARLGDADIAIWDARSAAEYAGTRAVAQRSGHIPGAVNIDWLELMDRTRNLRLVNLDTLQQRLNKLGLNKDKTIFTHCQTHHRSGLSYLAMKILGYPSIKGYHGSWSDWGNRDDTPIET